VLYTFVDRGLLCATSEGEEVAFLPARDLESITVKAALDALKGTAGTRDPQALNAVDAHIDRLLIALDAESTESRYNRSLKSLAEAALREGVRSPDPKLAPHVADSPARA
jgi:hypothetical protein